MSRPFGVRHLPQRDIRHSGPPRRIPVRSAADGRQQPFRRRRARPAGIGLADAVRPGSGRHRFRNGSGRGTRLFRPALRRAGRHHGCAPKCRRESVRLHRQPEQCARFAQRDDRKHDLLHTRPLQPFSGQGKGLHLCDGRSGRGEKRFESQSAGNRRSERQPDDASRKGASGIRIRAFAREAALLRRFDAEHPVPFAAHERPLLPGLGTDGAQQHPQGQCALPALLRRKRVPLHARPQSGRRRAGRHMEKRHAPLPGHRRARIPEKSRRGSRPLHPPAHRHAGRRFPRPEAGDSSSGRDSPRNGSTCSKCTN